MIPDFDMASLLITAHIFSLGYENNSRFFFHFDHSKWKMWPCKWYSQKIKVWKAILLLGSLLILNINNVLLLNYMLKYAYF